MADLSLYPRDQVYRRLWGQCHGPDHVKHKIERRELIRLLDQAGALDGLSVGEVASASEAEQDELAQQPGMRPGRERHDLEHHAWAPADLGQMAELLVE